jgi:serine/threonine-protein kinase
LGDAIELGQCTLEFQRSGLPASVFDHLPEGFLRSGRYTFGDVVVQGSTSIIYEAHDTSLDRDVAIKVMLPESQASAAKVLRFVREAQITSQLQHPNVPPIYELSVDESSQLFYTTRFVEGETLASILDRLLAGDPAAIGRWTLPRLLAVFQKVCDAAAFAHSHGVVHCALQAECVMVGSFGEVFVTGWGLAKVLLPSADENGGALRPVRAPESHAVPALSVATTPEQATGCFDAVDVRADVYALGALLYRILCLHNVVSGADETELLGQILTGLIPAPAARQTAPLPHCVGGKMPEYLSTIAMRALSSEPEDRQRTVPELQGEVAAWQEGLIAGIAASNTRKAAAGLGRRK